MDTGFEHEGISDFIESAFSGPNAFLFVALNILALAAYRRGHAWAFFLVAAMAAMIAGMSTMIEMEAKGGLAEPVRLTHAVMTSMITASASSLVVGYALVIMVKRLKTQKLETMLPPGNGPNGSTGPNGGAGKPKEDQDATHTVVRGGGPDSDGRSSAAGVDEIRHQRGLHLHLAGRLPR